MKEETTYEPYGETDEEIFYKRTRYFEDREEEDSIKIPKDFIEQQKKDSFVQGYNQALEDTGQKIKPERSHKAPDKV